MIRSKSLKLALLCGGIFALSACSVFGNRGNKDEATEAEKDGRIAMVLGDQDLQADPALAGTSIVLPEAEPVEDWPQAGRRSTKITGHLGVAQNFDIAWSVSAGRGSDKKSALTTPPVANSDTIFVIDAAQNVRAFSAATGSRRWQVSLDSGNRRDGVAIGSGIALDGEKLIVASAFGFVAALDINSGAELWRTEAEAPMIGSPAVLDGRIFVASNNNETIAFDANTGEVLWSDQAIAESARVLGSPSPAAADDIVIAPYSSGEIIAYLAPNGRRLWSEALSAPGQFTPISSINDIGARPVVGGGLVFATSQSGVMAAIEGRSGQLVWQQPVGSTQAPSLAGEYLFVSTTESQLVAVRAPTGQIFWVTQLEKYRNDKKKKGRITYAGPVLASGRLLVASSSGELIAINPETGTEMQRLRLGGPVFIEPIAVQDKLIVLTDEGRLIAIQ
ncbi:MAG: PQQ-binding-like beta-propeller repeat protein [Pseudomonadota bacterium]